MTKVLMCLLGLAVVATSPLPAFAQTIDIELLKELDLTFERFVSLEEDGRPPRYLYADASRHVHLYEINETGRSELVWETQSLGAPITGLFVKDLQRDGRNEIVIATGHGRIIFYDTDRFDLTWENLQDRFERVDCITAANIDRDPQDELILIAKNRGEEPKLYIYDTVHKNNEWRSTNTFEARQILLANTDSDEQLEIILNTGFVIDSKFFNIEWASDAPFGDRIAVMELSGDNYPEIVGTTKDYSLRVWDVYAEREIW